MVIATKVNQVDFDIIHCKYILVDGPSNRCYDSHAYNYQTLEGFLL